MAGCRVSSFESCPEFESLPRMKSRCFCRGATGRQAAGQRRDKTHAGTNPRLGHRTVGYAAVLGAGRASLEQGIPHPGWGGVTGGTGSHVEGIRYGV